MKEGRKVVGLVRVSTEGQAKDDRGGLPRQVEVIERTIAAQQLDCVETVALKGVSGTEVRGNKGIQRILKMIENRDIDGVVVADLDRLMRPAAGQDYALLDPFIDAKATIFANGQEFDFKNPAANLMVKLFLGFAEFERTLILNRSRGAIRELCRSGRHPFGMRQLPRGISYDRATNTWSTNDKLAPVVEAFRLMGDDYFPKVPPLSGSLSEVPQFCYRCIRRQGKYGAVRKEFSLANIGNSQSCLSVWDNRPSRETGFGLI